MVSEMGLSADFIHEKTGFGNFWGVLGRWGWFRPKTGHPRWPTSLPHRERGSPRLGKPHTWRISARSWPTLKYVTWVWYSWDQGWVIRTSETFNTVKYALIRNTRIIRYRVLCNLGVPVFDPKWTWFAPKSPKTFPILFQYIMCY